MVRSLVFMVGICIAFFAASRASGAELEKDPQAVQELQDGKRTDANAAWWGFDEQDSTEAIQSAILSSAKKVIIPNAGKEWIVRPIRLVGDQELVLEEGTVVAAKRGEFRSPGDTLFTADGVANLTIRGYGATLKMQKEDYIIGIVLKDLKWERWFGPYQKAEWRSTLALRGCTNATVLGLTLTDSGGDGVYVDGNSRQRFCKNIVLKDLVCDNHYRQGFSLISVDGLVVDNCVFKNTWGTPPSSGVDLEPDTPDQQLKKIVFKNCRFDDNYGDGIELFLANLKSTSEPISAVFENCQITSRRGSGIRVTKCRDDGPGGAIEFRDCTVENTVGYGIKVQDKSVTGVHLKYVRCTLRNTAQVRGYNAEWSPIWLHSSESDKTSTLGGFDFVDCVIEDRFDRPAISFTKDPPITKLLNVRGNIAVSNPHGVKTQLDAEEGGHLIVQEGGKP